jgi:hypothetical protein
MNAVLDDSSVVLDIYTGDPSSSIDPSDALPPGCERRSPHRRDRLSEVSIGFTRIEDLEAALNGAGFRSAAIPREALFLAGKAFLAYKRREASRIRLSRTSSSAPTPQSRESH